MLDSIEDNLLDPNQPGSRAGNSTETGRFTISVLSSCKGIFSVLCHKPYEYLSFSPGFSSGPPFIVLLYQICHF